MRHRIPSLLVLFAAASTAVATAQDSRPTTRPDDFAGLMSKADALWDAAVSGADSGRPGLFVRSGFEDAATAYGAAADAAPDAESRSRALFGVGWSFERAGRLSDALAAFTQAEVALPGAPGPAFAAAEALIRAGEFADARARAAPWLVNDDPDARGRATTLSLDAALGLGDRAAVLELFEEIVPSLPEAARWEPWRLVCFAFRDVVGDDFLPRLLDRATARTPSDSSAVFWKGDYALRRKRNAESLRHFRAFRDVRPDHSLADLCVGFAETRTGLLAEARASLESAIAAGAHEDSLLMALRELTAALVAKGDYDAAASVQGAVVRRCEEPEDALNLGVVLLDAGRAEESAKRYEALLERTDLDASARAKAWNFLGLNFRGRGLEKDAERCFRASIAAWDDERDGRENLAVLLLETGRPAEAEPLFRWCVARESNRKRSLAHLLRSSHPAVDGRARP